MNNYLANEQRYTNGMKYERCRHSGILLTRISLGWWHNFGALNNKASEQGQSLSEMALQWILAQQGVTSVLVGASSVEQLQQNIKAVLR